MTEPSHRRKNLRLPEYDYTLPGNYFITVCTFNRACSLGTIRATQVMLTPLGEIVRDCWLAIPAHFPTMTLDAYVVMPNHIHGIITIRADINGMPMVDNVTDQGRRGPSRQSLSAAVGSFKASVSRQFNVIRGASQPPVWQRDFYEHIIRNERSLEEIRAYVEGNPAAWHLDTENPYR